MPVDPDAMRLGGAGAVMPVDRGAVTPVDAVAPEGREALRP